MHVINGSSKLKSAGKKELKLTTNGTPEFKVKVAVRYAIENGSCQAPRKFSTSKRQQLCWECGLFADTE